MVTGRTSKVSQHLRRAALLQDGAGLTDGQLLGCFLEQRDGAAFAALVKRHGPMVWGVCRRLLRHHDAEDAFQAVFLVLSRKAASIRPREQVANYLYGVAHRTALYARRAAARRSGREKQVAEMPEPAVTGADAWHDLRPVLDDALSRLPDQYRVVVVLCDLEGKTRKEAARQLGCPEGTVAGRLARARGMLARRLARQGVGLSGAALAAVLMEKAASAGVPASVAAAAVEAAGQAAGGVASARVVTLVDGMVKTMLLSKLKTVMTVWAAAGVVALGGGLLLYPRAAAQQGPAGGPPAGAAKAAPATQPEGKKSADAADRAKLQATWQPTTTEIDGLRFGEGRPELKDATLVIEGSSLTIAQTWRSNLTQPEVKKSIADFTLRTGSTPRVMVLTWKGNPPFNGKPGSTQEAIYKVQGDTLTLCLSMDTEAKARPNEFSAPAGSMRLLWTFKREAAGAKGGTK